MRKLSVPFARFALFVIYFWFGLLKVLGESPAGEMVRDLFELTVSKMVGFLTFDQFFLTFAIFEMIIGILFLLPRFEKVAFALLILHLVSTALPLFMMGEMIWVKDFVPTLEGQYIIKNLALLGLGMFLVSRDK